MSAGGSDSAASGRPDEVSPLPREEYIEQMHLFEVLGERLKENMPAQEVLDSVTKTGRLVCADEASPRCSIAADVSAQVAMQAFGALKAGIEMVTPPHVPVPFSPALEDLYIPSGARIADAVRRTLKGGKH